METILGAFIGVGGTVVGVLIAHYLSKKLIRATHTNALQLIQIGEFNKAATKFREAFMPVRIALNPAKFPLGEDLAIFLERHFQDLRRAIVEFSDFLDANTKSALLEAWYEYHCHQNARDDKTVPYFGQYSCVGLRIEQQHAMKSLVQDRIDKILEFAKPK